MTRNVLLCFHCNWLHERAAVLGYTLLPILLGFSLACSAYCAAINKSWFRSDCLEPEFVPVVTKLRPHCRVHSDCCLVATKSSKPFSHRRITGVHYNLETWWQWQTACDSVTHVLTHSLTHSHSIPSNSHTVFHVRSTLMLSSLLRFCRPGFPTKTIPISDLCAVCYMPRPSHPVTCNHREHDNFV